MNDRILQSYLDDFKDQFNLADLDEPTAFEYMTSHCIVSKHNPENFSPEDIVVGGRGDLGLDGAAVLANGHVVLSKGVID